MATRDYTRHFVNPNEPSNTAIGDEWLDSDNNLLYKRLVLNGTTVTWTNDWGINAASATRLRTSITINGTIFDGATNVVIDPFVDQDLSTDVARFIPFVDSSSAGYQRLKVDDTITYNPNTGILTLVGIQGSGQIRSTAIVSNTWIHATQNLTVASSNASITTTTGAAVITGGVGIGGALNVGGQIYTTGVLNAGGTAVVNALISNGAITGTTGTFTSVQNSGLERAANIVSNTWIHATQNLTVASSNISTTTGTGAAVVTGGVGVGGNINVGGTRSLFTGSVGVGTSAVLGANSNVLSVYGTAMVYGNIDFGNPAGGTSGIYFNDGSYQTTAFTGAATPSFGTAGTVQFAGAANTFSGNGDNFFWDTANNRLGVGTNLPTNVLTVRSTATPAWFNTTNSAVSSNNFEIIVGNGSSTGTTVGYVNNTLVPYGYLSAGTSTRNLIIAANGRVGVGGVTAPQVLLDVGGGAVFGSSWAGNTNFINPPASGIAVQGSVGIGTYTPLAALDVRGGVGVTAASNFNSGLSVASLTSNGAIAGTTITGTTGTFTSIQTSGNQRAAEIVSNTWIHATQNLTVASTNIAISTTTGALRVSGGVGVAGNIVAGGEIVYENTRLYAVTRTMPTVVNDIVEIGSVSLDNGGGMFEVSVVVPSSSFSVSKHYILPIAFAETAGVWSIAQPIGDTGAYSGNDYELDISVNGAVASLRLRRTVGSTVGTAYVSIKQSGITLTFIESTATASVTAPTVYYSATAIRQLDGRVGIGTFAPLATLDVRGGVGVTAASNFGGALAVASLASNGAVSGTTGTFTGALYGASFNTAGAATVASLVSNGAVSGTTGTFTGALYGASFNTAGTATVNALVSNTDVKTATVNASSTIVGQNIYSNGFVQAAGTVEGNAIDSNTTITAGTGLTVTSGGMNITGVSQFTGNVNIAGNLNVTGTINTQNANVLVVQDPIIYLGEGNTGNNWDLGLVGNYNDGVYEHTGLVRNHVTGVWTLFDTLPTEPNVNTGNVDWTNSSLTYAAFLVGNVNVAGRTESVSTTTGAIRVTGTGGVGIGGRLNVGGSAWFAGVVNAGGALIANSINSNTNVVGVNIQSTGQASVASLVSNGAVSGTTGTFTGALYGASFNTAGTATVASLVSNGAVSGTTGTFTGALYGASFNTAGTATVNALVSNGSISGTTITGTAGTFSTSLYSATFNTAGTATVNALVSNGAITGTTITGTAATLTSSQNSGLERAANIVSNTWIHATQNLTVASSNASISTTTGALIVSGGAGIAGAVHAGGSIYSAATLNIAGAAQVNSLVSNGTITGTTGTFTSIQNSGLERAANIVSNTWIHATQNLTVASSNTSVSTATGALVVTGGAGIGGNVVAGSFQPTLSVIATNGMYLPAANTVAVSTVSTERIRIDSNGNMGIGTSTANARLDISTTAATGIRVYSEQGVSMDLRGRSGDNSAQIRFYDNSNTLSAIFGLIGTDLRFYTGGNNERMRINATGNLLINSTVAPLGGNATVTIQGIGTNGPGVQLSTGSGGALIDGLVGGGITVKTHTGAIGSETYTERMRVDSAGNVGIGTSTVQTGYKLQVQGGFAAITKSFVIEHPTKPGMKLQYASLEGPENGVYIRGRLTDSDTIELPDYWIGLVDKDTVTVDLTAVGSKQDLWIVSVNNNIVTVGSTADNIDCFYTVYAERKDIDKLVVEYGDH